MRRLRVTATIDKDTASPDSIQAAQTFLTAALLERAEDNEVALNWNTWHSYSRRTMSGDLVIIQWARVI